MLVNVCPPFLHGTKVTSRQPGQLEMTVVVRGAFRLAPGEPVAPIDDLAKQALQGDLFGDDDDDRTGALLHASDFADFKLRTDLLLKGTCYPGEGRASPVCTARFAVGSWSKSLRVLGRRVWTERAFDPISEPLPFTSMPITYENAFGGPELAQNPVGKGYRTAELPTVEDPAALLGSRRDTPEPAGFGPLSPSWPQRAGKVGTEYGKAWKKTRAPFYAADFDWSHFNSAPADQQLPGYLRGDEALVFEYLHPRAIRFSASLPGLRPRVVCRRTDGLTTEVPMNLDTLLADLDGERLVLLWRGLARVTDDQLDDVRTLFLGCEPLAAPLPAAHYLAELDAFEKDPLGYLRDRLMPAESKLRIAEARAAIAQATAQAAAPPKPEDPADHVEALLGAHGGALPAEQAGQRDALLGQLRSLLQSSKGQLPKLSAQARAAGGPTPTTAGALAALTAALAAQKAMATARGLPTDRLDAAEKQLAQAEEQQRAADAAVAASGKPDPRAAADTAATAAMSGPDGAAKSPAEEAPGPGANLIERDLSGWDLRGADLHGALLHGAKLVGTRLAGANLRGADLGDADLTDADLTGAHLGQANLAGVKARGAVFDEATLARTIFVKADLTGASLERVQGTMSVFQQTELSSAKLRGARLHKAAFSQANLDDADFTGAELDICTFLDVSAARARFDEVRLFKTSFLRSKMPGASFVEASGEGCSWQESVLDGADFRYAKLRRAQLNKASLHQAKLYASDFRGGRFERASLAEADFGKANLMSVSFNKARLAATDFSGASLYDAKFLGAVATVKCNFDGADLTLAIWEQP
jgi:uncharacterized protein YjbI with pentapeptide repeats